MNHSRPRFACLAVLVYASLGTVVIAVPPGARINSAHPNGPGGEFIPTADFLRTVQLLQIRRSLQNRGFALAPGLILAVRGTRMVPVVCVEFANTLALERIEAMRSYATARIGPTISSRPRGGVTGS